MRPSRSGRSAIIPPEYRRDGRWSVRPCTIAVAPLLVQVDVVRRAVDVPLSRTPGGRQPISENFKPFGPTNHSMCVADVPMPSAWITLRAHQLAPRRSSGASMRFVATICGEIQRVRIASSTFG